MTLLYIPHPLPEESGASLLLRASYNNGYKNLLTFLNAYGFPVHYESLNTMLSDQKIFKDIINKLGICESSINIIPRIDRSTKRLLRKWKSSLIPSYFFCKDGSKLCPQCVTEYGILKREWLLNDLKICVIHKIKLLECCSYCKKPISANRKQIDECIYCHKKFININNIVLSSDEIIANRWFLEALESSDEELIKNINHFLLAINNTLRTFKNIIINESPILLLYWFFTNKFEAKKIFINIALTNRNIAHYKLLLSFFSTSSIIKIRNLFLNEIFNEAILDTYTYNSLSSDFILKNKNAAIIIDISIDALRNPIYNILKKNKKISAFKINEYLLGNLSINNEIYPSRNIIYNNIENNFFNFTQASNHLGINYYSLHKLCFKDMIFTKFRIKYKSRYHYFIKKIEVEKFHKEFITGCVLAKKFGIKLHYLTLKLMSLNILPIHGPTVDGLKINVYRKDDVQHLTTRILESSTNFDNNLENQESKILNSKLKKEIGNLKKLLNFRCFHPTKSSPSELYNIRPYSLSFISHILNSDNYISFSEAIIILECKSNLLNESWIDLNCLIIIDLSFEKYIHKSNFIKIFEIRKIIF